MNSGMQLPISSAVLSDMVAGWENELRCHPSTKQNRQDSLADLMDRFGFQTLHHVGRDHSRNASRDTVVDARSNGFMPSRNERYVRQSRQSTDVM